MKGASMGVAHLAGARQSAKAAPPKQEPVR